jgi:hypothetical protein
MIADERQALVFMARTAETAERYEDMCKIMRELVTSTGKSDQELTVEERNLLSVAYKNVIGSRRAAWRTLNAGVDEGKFDDLVVAYRKQVEGELSEVCLDVLDLLENVLVKNSTKENEARVFYLKMTGDYYRYLAEFVTDKGMYNTIRHSPFAFTYLYTYVYVYTYLLNAVFQYCCYSMPLT